MKVKAKKILSMFLALVMLFGMIPVSVLAAETTPKVTIVSFMRGAQTDLRSSELLEARVEGYDGNVRELTYKWYNSIGTYLYIYNSHNMYNINNTDGEQEIYNSKVSSSSNMSGRSHKDSFAGVGYAWASIYGANLSGSSLAGTIKVEVYDKDGKFLCSDTHEGKYSNRKNTGIVTYNLDSDMDNVVIGMFVGDKRNVLDLLGESAVVHITCVESKVDSGKVIGDGETYIKLTKEDGDYYITGIKAGTSTGSSGDAQVDLDITKSNCKFHNDTSGDAITTVFVFEKPTTTTTTTTLTLAANSLDERCEYFIGGVKGEQQEDGTILFTGLTPNTDYTVEVRGEYKDNNGATKYAYAYVYDTTKPVYQATVRTYLDGVITDISAIHGEDVTLYLHEDKENAEYISLDKTDVGTYTAAVTNGIYFPWHIEAEDHYHQAREYKLIIENANGELNLHHYSVTYDTDGGAFKAGEEVSKEVYSSMAAVEATKNIPVKDGFIFVGWETDGKTYNAGETVTAGITAPITLTAKWEKAVNVTVNVVIDHKYQNGYDNNENKDELTVNFLEMKKDSPAFVETGDILNFAKDGVTDKDGNLKAYEYTVTQKGEAVLETRYTATAPTYEGLLESSTFGVSLSKSGYDVGVIEKIKDENGNWTINIPLTYNPEDFDLEFSVKMAEDVPKPLYPDAVIVKIACWSAESNEWVIISQQRTTENTVRPGVRVDIDPETGMGQGSYPVWTHKADGSVYGYRAVVTGFIYDGSTIIVPTQKDHTKEDGFVEVTYTDGNYTATMGDVADGQRFSTSLNGAYYNESTKVQQGTLDAVISVEKYNVTFDAQGGTIRDAAAYTVVGQYYIPEFAEYVPVMEGHGFRGWYLDKECTLPATEGELLTKNITLYAEWDKVITGELIADGYYTDGDKQIPVDKADRATHALVELEEIADDGTYNIAGTVVEIKWVEGKHFSEPVAYEFTGLDPDKTYRIDVYLMNYTVAYQNSTTVKGEDEHNSYNEDDYTAVYTEESRWETYVNTFLHFEPEIYAQNVEVDTTRIGEDFRPGKALVEYYSMEVGIPNDFVLIVQHKTDPYGVEVGLTAEGKNNATYGEKVWKKNFNGNLYDYQANLTKLIGGQIDSTSVSDWPVVVVYGEPVRWSPYYQEAKDTLKVEVVPRGYSITYNFGFDIEKEDGTKVAYKEVDYYGHIWSYDTVITYAPERLGYDFLGWFDAPDGGNEVKKIDAAVHNDTELYAHWQERTDCSLKVYYETTDGYPLSEGDTITGLSAADKFTAEEIRALLAEEGKGEFEGYTYKNASVDSVSIKENAEENEITFYYSVNSYGYTFNFLDKKTFEPLADPISGEAAYGTYVTKNAEDIKGYSPDKPSDTVFISVDDEMNVVNFYYEKNEYDYTVNYLDKNTGNVVAESKTASAIYGEEVTEAAIDVKGYTIEDETSKTIEIDTEGNVINFYYTVNSYAYTVNYLEYGTDKVLAPAESSEAVYGTEVEKTAKDIEGYSVIDGGVKTLVIDTENNVINFYYSANAYGYTVNYLEEGTEKALVSAKTSVMPYGSEIEEEAIAIDRYLLVSQNKESIVIGKENNVITFWYTADKVGGGENGGNGDGIPDKYQKKVIFEIINGKWSDDSKDDIIIYVTLLTDGKWDENGSADLTAPEGMKADEGYENGGWEVVPPAVVSGTQEEKYTYVFDKTETEPDNPGTPDNPDNPDNPDDPDTPDNPDVPDTPVDPDAPGGNGGVNSDRKHHILFGKTDGIGWYSVSMDGGETFRTVFGNSTLEVPEGTELIIRVGDLTGDAFTFYVNGNAIEPDDDGNLVITVDGYMLIGALGYKIDVPDVEESLNWFQKIIKAIKDFFAMIFGKK